MIQIKTFKHQSLTKLDAKVNSFLAQPDITVHRIHASMSFGTFMIMVEHEQR